MEQLARRGERNRPGAPFEQLDAEQRFKPADLVTDGARGDVELLRCLGQAQVPRRRLEGPQGIQWRRRMHEKSSLISRELILCHAGEPGSTFVGLKGFRMRTPQRSRAGYPAMNAIAPRHDFARGHAIAPPRGASPRSGFLRCIVDTIVRARQRREERELARQFNRYGRHLTNDVERRIFEEMTRNRNFRV